MSWIAGMVGQVPFAAGAGDERLEFADQGGGQAVPTVLLCRSASRSGSPAT